MRISDLDKIKGLGEGEHCFVNWYMGGGGVVYRVRDVFVVFEVTAYGGNEYYCDTVYTAEDALKLCQSFT